ncbi:hypothetical protein GT204_14530 [Streptomyces sp. SID4919]|uniref:Uncharacterized protein n=2 Tax=Streptomyces uncialis TaxID=1048205 RepID=A0A1Q4VFU0_9ACTN|nr:MULTISPECIES: hypothetical protein [unclassified Streptomyces]MYY10087.1 hypothetical protein [Streptomyces sp. SID4919]OKH96675.1 hypothetical protein AB852_03070 [Streptomyces uncialis]WTE12331.1 hypothetical protein OG924_19960 [Streptomyces uncialis]SCK50399.1 hypothetical protein YW7DRAFT_04544 [Streptomyces sp. AmelKG-E11A]
MLTHKDTRIVATESEMSAVGTLMLEPETTVSGAPVYAPEAAGLLLALLLLSPKEPKEPTGK